MSKGTEIFDAIRADLVGITVAGGYQIGVKKIYTKPPSKEKMELPCAALSPVAGGLSGDSETQTIGDGINETSEEIQIEGLLRSSDANRDVLRFRDDIRNALEKPGSAVRAVSGVARVNIKDWEQHVTPDSGTSEFGLIIMRAEVTYTYRKGAL